MPFKQKILLFNFFISWSEVTYKLKKRLWNKPGKRSYLQAWVLQTATITIHKYKGWILLFTRNHKSGEFSPEWKLLPHLSAILSEETNRKDAYRRLRFLYGHNFCNQHNTPFSLQYSENDCCTFINFYWLLVT